MPELSAEEKPIAPKKISRRSLLKSAAGAVGAAALGTRPIPVRAMERETGHESGKTDFEAFVTSNEFLKAKERFHEETALYVDILNTGVSLTRRAYGLETERESASTDPKFIMLRDFLNDIALGYKEIDWYVQTPAYLPESARNFEAFRQWITGRPQRKPIVDDFSPQPDYDVNLSGQSWLSLLGSDVGKNMLHQDRHRIRKLTLGEHNLTNPFSGDVEWEAKPYSQYKIQINEGSIRTLVHETTHAAVPHIRKTPPGEGEPDQRFTIGLESGDVLTIIAFDQMWGRTFVNNIDFFKKRFFDVQGDTTFGWIRDEGAMGLRHALFEFQAMLCADLALPDMNQSVTPENYPPDVMDSVLKTWNFIRNGQEAVKRIGDKIEFIPLPESEIAAEKDLPDGRKSVRQELHRALHDYQNIFAQDVGIA